MDLLLIRHAAAVDRDAWAGADSDRPLTLEGAARFARAVRGLRRLSVRLDHLQHSPWQRAAHTAELLTPLCRGPRTVAEALAEPPTPQSVEALLLNCAGAPCAAWVGHEPWLTALVTTLTGVSLEAAFDWKKGGVVWLSSDGPDLRPGWTVRALLPPFVLRTLGEAPHADT